MHIDAHGFVRRILEMQPLDGTEHVVEIGGRDINGSIRDLFQGQSYTAIDIAPGVGVDVVASGADYRHVRPIDVAVCCEVLEHTPDVRAILENMAQQLTPGGRLLITTAGPQREPHSAVDGASLQDGEYYRNLDPRELYQQLTAIGLAPYVEIGRQGLDVWAVGTKPGGLRKPLNADEPVLRVLLVHPGASISISDVHTGLLSGMRALGHQIFDYNLDVRIERSAQWLNFNWKKTDRTLPAPSQAATLYHASEELVARALRVQPDVVLVTSAMFLHPDVFVLMRRAGLRVAVLFTESPYDDTPQQRLLWWADDAKHRQVLRWIDLAWTNERTTAQSLGIRYLPHAWHTDVHRTDTVKTAAAHDVVFVGTGFQERVDLLSAIDWTGIDFGLYGAWRTLGSRHPLRKHLRDKEIENTETAALYRHAKIGLNLYRTSIGFGKTAPKIAHAESLNPRAYELAATGCFTLSDHRAEVVELFHDLVPTFTTPARAEALIRYWLRNDSERERIRAALPAAVAGHTWHARAEQITADLASVGIEARRSHYIPLQLETATA